MKLKPRDIQKLAVLRDKVLSRGARFVDEKALDRELAFAPLVGTVKKRDPQMVILDHSALTAAMEKVGMGEVLFADLSYGYQVGYTFDIYGGGPVHHVSVSMSDPRGRIRESILREIQEGLGVPGGEDWSGPSPTKTRNLVVRASWD